LRPGRGWTRALRFTPQPRPGLVGLVVVLGGMVLVVVLIILAAILTG
jgi:hypothetical protein